jgi:hypothetical protein
MWSCSQAKLTEIAAKCSPKQARLVSFEELMTLEPDPDVLEAATKCRI